MRRISFLFLGFMLLFAFGCPGEQAPEPAASPEPAEGAPAAEEPAQPEDVPVEEPEEPIEEPGAPEEVQNETAEEEPVEEVECVPITLTGTAEVVICTEDSLYCNLEGDKQVVSAREMEVGRTLNLPSKVTVTLEDIALEADCGECGKKPTWTYSQLAKLRISVPEASEDVVVYADVGDTGTFVSKYKCKTLDWDGKTCLEWIPDEEYQYYVGKIVADKVCVEHTGE